MKLFAFSSAGNEALRLALPVLGLVCLLATPVMAVEEDIPFAFDYKGWRSIERFGEKEPEPQPEIPIETVQADPAAEEAAGMAAVRLSTLPGIKTDFDIRIDSTADLSYLDSVNLLDEKKAANWQDAEQFLQHRASRKLAVQETEEGRKVNIRLPMLPARMTEPVRAGFLKNATDDFTKPQTAKPEVEATAPTATATASCPSDTVGAAIKKKQLQAIDSDRQTLAALKAAITDLKAEDALGFMTQINGTLATSAPMDTPTADSLLNTLKN